MEVVERAAADGVGFAGSSARAGAWWSVGRAGRRERGRWETAARRSSRDEQIERAPPSPGGEELRTNGNIGLVEIAIVLFVTLYFRLGQIDRNLGAGDIAHLYHMMHRQLLVAAQVRAAQPNEQQPNISSKSNSPIGGTLTQGTPCGVNGEHVDMALVVVHELGEVEVVELTNGDGGVVRDG
uniref:Uncharacterized protein n=2 Tax=Oryza sativa subsp. japonica TaxID=39947 RepID=Q10KF2_ORYSJ|nr:hypothetical protein [Oryza sativa Japonica Group]ABF96317.1 hypothetical protein LOC_Os03g26940 [Oryza sativa Japonica Group]